MDQPWNLPENQATPHSAYLNRRNWLKKMGLLAVGGAAIGGGAYWYLNQGTDEEIIAAGQLAEREPIDWTNVAMNERFADAGREQSSLAQVARYCNFYEFSQTKGVWAYIDDFEPLPWKVEITGEVRRPVELDVDDILRTFPLEQRVLRHRCVETWAMVVPWIGFPLKALVDRVEPLPNARYVKFVSFFRPEQASRQNYGSFPWPYTEGLTLAEATNDLAFVAVGMYGQPLLKQNGAPIRLVLPWKYGFKSSKSIVRIEFTSEQPMTFWNMLAPHEYGFEANVDPEIPHPRWSQASEWMLGTRERFPTQLYNGYGEWVANLYQ